jgi:hypothetical protein
MKLLLCILSVFLLGCQAPEKADKEKANKDIGTIFDEYSWRLINDHRQNGYIVSRYVDGSPEHLGEGLLWSGIAMDALPCVKAAVFAKDLFYNIRKNNGQLERIDPIAGPTWDYGQRGGNFDSETGYYFGWISLLTKCPELSTELKETWEIREDYLEENDRALWPAPEGDSPVKMMPEFTFTRDAISHEFGLRGRPHDDRLRLLEIQLLAWATAVYANKSPCYRVNLSLLHIMGLEKLGYEFSDTFKASYCEMEFGMDIPTLSHWCGNPVPLGRFISEFVPNSWEFRYQRCGKWEVPDGKPNLKTPALDLLWGMKIYYNLDQI